MAITRGYCTLSEVRAACRIPATDTSEDTMIESVIEGASRRIDGYCGRFFYQVTTALSIYPSSIYSTAIPDLSTGAGITVKTDTKGDGTFATTWTSGQYMLNPTDTALNGHPYTRIVAIGGNTFPMYILPQIPTLQITGVWGWAAIPDDIREACVLLSMRMYSRYNAPLGVAGFSDMGAITVRTIDPDVRDLLNPYQIIATA